MGDTCQVVTHIIDDTPDSLCYGDIINIIGLVINLIVGGIILFKIQSRENNKRVLKDHFIEEIKQLKSDYRDFIDKLYLGEVNAREAVTWFKMTNVRVNELVGLMNQKYKVHPKVFEPYQITLRNLITNSEDFIRAWNSPTVQFSEESKKMILAFRTKYENRFNKVIIDVNDAS